MRDLIFIESDIHDINKKMDVLRAQLSNLKKERVERLFFDFCEKYKVKKGDIVRTKADGNLVIFGLDINFPDWATCYKIKKNGEPYKVLHSNLQFIFEGCEVIGHIDIEDQTT